MSLQEKIGHFLTQEADFLSQGSCALENSFLFPSEWP